MMIFHHEPPIEISGRTLTVLCRIELTGIRHEGAMLFSGAKQPVAIICREDGGEEIFGLDGEHMDVAALKALMSTQDA